MQRGCKSLTFVQDIRGSKHSSRLIKHLKGRECCEKKNQQDRIFTFTVIVVLLFDAKSTLGPFLEIPGNFSGPKPKFEIKTRKAVARVLAHKQVHFVSLTDSSIVLLSKLTNRRS